MNLTTVIIAGVVTLVALGAAACGLASAQEGGQPDGAGRREAFREKIAANLGVTSDDLKHAFRDAALQTVEEAASSGAIDDERAAELRERIESGEWPGLRQLKGRGKAGHALRGIVHSAAAAIGITPQELKQAFEDGVSVADVAAQHGVTLDEVKAHIIADAQAELDRAVERGRFDATRADRLLEQLSARLDEALAKPR